MSRVLFKVEGSDNREDEATVPADRAKLSMNSDRKNMADDRINEEGITVRHSPSVECSKDHSGGMIENENETVEESHEQTSLEGENPKCRRLRKGGISENGIHDNEKHTDDKVKTLKY